MIVELALILIFTWFYFYWRENYSKSARNRPPGPRRLPFIGNLHQIVGTGKTLNFEAFDVLSQKHGPLMSLKIGMKEAVIVSSLEDMSSLLTRDECNGRVLDEFIADRSWKDDLGLVFSSGPRWKTIRRFTISNLRDFGFGKKHSMESVMEEEIQVIIKKVQSEMKSNGKVHVDLFFNMSMLNILWSMVAGKRFSHDDPRLQFLLELVARCFRSATFGSDLSIAFPFVRHIFPELLGANVIKKGIDELQRFFNEIIEEHRSRPDHAENPESFIDVFLAKIDEVASTPENTVFSDKQLIVVLMDLFVTGEETLGGSLSYALLFMILNPEVQRKVQQEIDSIVPQESPVLFQHKSKMIYTQAVLLEILRLGDIVPLIPPRKVLKDFTYKGYHFQKDLTIIPSLYSVFKWEWEEPKEFRPERFIGADGQLTNTERLPAFGFGKRYCMGESLATPAFFLFFTSLLKKFEFYKISDEPDPTTVPLPAFTLSPQPFYLSVKIRT